MSDQVWGMSDPKLYAPTPQGYGAIQNTPAQRYVVQPGNIDLSKRQMIDNPVDPIHPDPRHYGSEYSARDTLPQGHPFAGHQMSYPTIYDGTVHPRQEAFKHAIDTNQHMGIYHGQAPGQVIDQAETALHARPIYVNGKLLNGDMWAAMKKKKISDVVKK